MLECFHIFQIYTEESDNPNNQKGNFSEEAFHNPPLLLNLAGMYIVNRANQQTNIFMIFIKRYA